MYRHVTCIAQISVIRSWLPFSCLFPAHLVNLGLISSCPAPSHSLTHPSHPHLTPDLSPSDPDHLACFQSQWCMYVIEIVFLMFKEQVGGVATATGKCILSLCSRTSFFSQSPGNLAMAGRTRSQEQKRKEERWVAVGVSDGRGYSSSPPNTGK